VVLPWFAVVIANGGDHAEVHSDSLLDYAPLAELDAPGGEDSWVEPPATTDGGPAQPVADDAPTTLQGELIDDEDEDQGQAAS
jgi:hypothetical protein